MKTLSRCIALGAEVAALACNSGSPGPGGAGGAGGAGGGGGGGGANTGALSVEVDRQGSRTDIQHVDLDVTRISFFFGAGGGAQADGKACVFGNAFLDLRTSIRLDVSQPGRTPVATFETGDERSLVELRIFLKAAHLDRKGQEHDADGGLTCVDADGSILVVIVVKPQQEIHVAHGDRLKVIVRFDARDDVLSRHVVCAATAPGGGGGGGGSGGDGGGGDGGGGGGGGAGGGGGGGSMLAQASGDDAPECEDPDDLDDDANPGTRLRFDLPLELTCRPEKA